MNSIFINGSIEITNKEFYKILLSIDELDNSKLELKERDFGYEIGYEDEHIYIYIHGNELEKKGETLIFDCEYKKEIDNAHLFINSIEDLLQNQGIPYYSFEYAEGDGKGNDIGEEFEIKFPED
ncbi:hypothetical protein DZC78_10040 [Olleya aquimaris]|nr:hypothetical protein DZC78_10040 [Olleya aquimaris]